MAGSELQASPTCSHPIGASRPSLALAAEYSPCRPRPRLVEAEDRTDSTAYAGLGVRGYLTNRFLLQAEYRSYVVFTSQDDNEEIDAWSVAFTYFF